MSMFTETMHFIFDEAESLTVKEYFDKFKDKLPDLIMVTGGHYGLTNYDDYATDQVIRFHTYSSQRRVIARASGEARACKLEYLSIPVDTRSRFRVVHGPNRVDPLNTMTNILEKQKLPFLVRFGESHPEVHSAQGKESSELDSDYLIIREYKENYLLGNCLINGEIYPQTTTAALSSNIQITSIKGIEGKNEEEFQEFLASMDKFVRDKKLKFDRNIGNPAITKFQLNSTETGTGGSIDEKNPLITLGEVIPDLEKEPPPVPPRRGEASAILEDDEDYCEIKPEIKLHPPIPKSKEDAKPPQLPPRPPDLEKKSSKKVATSSKPTVNYPYVNNIQMCTVSPTSKTTEVKGTPKHLADLNIKEVGECLKMLKLDQYVQSFADDMIDGTMLNELNEEILKNDYKFRPIEAIRLLKYVKTGHIPS